MSKTAGPRIFVTISRQASAGRGRTDAPRPARLRQVVHHTLARGAPHVVGDIGVLLTGDDEMRRLNHRFRGLDKATDVLAFPLGDGLTAGQPFGDVVISAQTAHRQAREYGGSFAGEIDRLLVHGTLHLCGYDHHERREAARMHGLTASLLRELQAVRANAAATKSSGRSRA